MNAVPAGLGTDRKENVADALRTGADQIRLAQNADRHGVDQWVATVARRERDFAAEGRHTDAIAIITNSLHRASEEKPIPGFVERPEAKRVEHGDRTSAHGEDIAEDAPDARGGTLVRLHGGRVVV